jgi:uncharacterized membrane protein
MEKIISRTLRYGVVLSALFMLAGLIVYALNPAPLVLHFDASPAQLLNYFRTQPLSVVVVHPYFLMFTGILILLFTPILRVTVAVVSFGMEKDWRFVWVSGLVLTIIISSVILALV